eukprot:10382715-Alexandrium_andersonii.AAC.1
MFAGRFSLNLGAPTTEREDTGVPGGGVPTGAKGNMDLRDSVRPATLGSGSLSPSCLGLTPALPPPAPPGPSPPSPPPP